VSYPPPVRAGSPRRLAHVRFGVSPYRWPVLRVSPLGIRLPATTVPSGTTTQLQLEVGDGITFGMRAVAEAVGLDHTQLFRACDRALLRIARTVVAAASDRRDE
jgi:hypothetical protein